MEKFFDMRLLPSFIKGVKATFILNHVNCEAYRDKLLFVLKRKNK